MDIRRRFSDQLLTTSRIISEILDGLTRRTSRRDKLEDAEVRQGFTVARACIEFWDSAAYSAFYDRNGVDSGAWAKYDLCARTLGIERQSLQETRNKLIQHFR